MEDQRTALRIDSGEAADQEETPVPGEGQRGGALDPNSEVSQPAGAESLGWAPGTQLGSGNSVGLLKLKGHDGESIV
ncbi:hypothetical protein GCM10009555_005070 [Acrocarpospora macrocephala]|uniref:Uncharacterized protein n=1 Tax=Acrocarpospora macrocephala TaxID=150177 RepID=A0A5M3WV45_9ACTN|nr:hypothetical protein Amac_068820 [Acrocarpospora macrocephala]